MRRQLFMVLVVALFIAGMVPVYAQVRPNVVVGGFRVVNGTADVGKSFLLAVDLVDTEPSACAYAVTVTLQGGAPFVFDGVSTLDAGSVCNGAQKTVYFPLRIDPTANGGTYPLAATMNYETTTLAQFSSQSAINLFVSGTPDLRATIVGSDPVDVYPGDTATLTVDVANDGTFQAQAVQASLSADAPLDVKWALSADSLGTIDGRSSKQATFAIEVPKDAPAVDYPVRLTLQYLDEKLVSRTAERALTFHVAPKALFVTSDAGSDALYANSDTRALRISLKNTGTDTARKMKVKLLPQFPFSTDGSVRYVDVLPAGGTAPVEFTVNVDKDAMAGAYGLDVLLDFEDAQGKKLQDTAKVTLTVQHKSLFRAAVLDYWFLWLVAAIIVFAIVRKRVAAGKKKK